MPVPTETFRNIKKLNLIFAASSVLMLIATGWMVVADNTRGWKKYQLDTRDWEYAMVQEAQVRAQSGGLKTQIAEAKAELSEVRQSLAADEIARIEAELSAVQDEIARAKLPTEVSKGEVNPATQQYERALAEHGPDHPLVKALGKEMRQQQNKYTPQAESLAINQAKLDELLDKLAALRAAEANKVKRVAELERGVEDMDKKLATLKPKGAAHFGEFVRNQPLLDWFNPSLKPLGEPVFDIYTDYNFMTVETVDRCKTCHFNIDKPAFDRVAQVAFVERQMARLTTTPEYRVDMVDRPVVLRDFWQDAALAVPALHERVVQVREKAFEMIVELAEEAEQEDVIDSVDELDAELAKIEQTMGNEAVGVKRWNRVLEYYRDDLQALLANHLGEREYAKLAELYRRRLIDEFNGLRREKEGTKDQLSGSPVLLAHPRLDRFVESESSHPMKTMGCSVCHEGSGQETQFEHTAHEPRSAWVDAQTGTLVPDFLVVGQAAGHGELVERAAKRRLKARAVTETEIDDSEIVLVSADAAGEAHGDDHTEGGGDHGGQGHRYSQYDVNLLSSSDQTGYDAAPFAPVPEAQPGDSVMYLVPGAAETRRAVRQADYWTKTYGWHRVHYTHWEKPMHVLEHVESSCNKCHTEVFDLQTAAPQLFEGRKLFAQYGCVNCHAVESLEDDLDIKRVGPDLTFVKHKLSKSMMSAWVWAPKAFRPTTKMPHYFMLENNSQPVDILRTRVEVAAIAHYLKNASPSETFYKDQGRAVPPHEPEAAPAEAGDAERGQVIFNNVGCLACHSNLAQFGEQWIVEDLVERGHNESEAAEQYASWTYNQRHTYVLANLPDRLERTGPELSGVGTKLKTGRSEDEARAWLYDWLRNPRHYSSYTIMPNMRLSAAEANDLTAYLLSLERPGVADAEYSPGDFELDESGRNMLTELVALLEPGLPIKLARQRADAKYTSDDARLMRLGAKMVQHYGCNGCHLINGFEAAGSACTNLDDWGLKDPHKLAFEYFDHTFDEIREKPVTVTKVRHEGLAADAPFVTPDAVAGEEDAGGTIHDVDIHWEHIDLERRPWLYQKLHNTRVYDRGRVSLNGAWQPGETFDPRGDLGHTVGKPYDKLKMPKFMLPDDQVRSLVTFVTSIRKPLVAESMQQTSDDAGKRMARGRQIATQLNCYGCHNIEGNTPNFQQYFNVRDKDGYYNENALNWVPPRLIGQGAKTQPDWLYHFLQNVETVRPWLKVRMPSFAVSGDHAYLAQGLVDYFAGHSQTLSKSLAEMVEPVDAYIEQYLKDYEDAAAAEVRWFESPSLAKQTAALRAYAVMADLAVAADLDPRYVDAEELNDNWQKVLHSVRALAATYETDYPYTQKYKPAYDPMKMKRAEGLFAEIGCMTGECHRIGDEQLLIDEGFLTVGDPFSPGGEEEEELDDDEEDEEGEGEEEGGGFTLTPSDPPAGAPNLSLTAERLSPHWVTQWMRHAHSIQPGTRMQQIWEDPEDGSKDASGFAMLTDEDRKAKEALYGSTVEQQRDLLMYFLYTAGPRRLTYSPNPDVERLGAGEVDEVTLEPLAPLEGGSDDADADASDADTSAGDDEVMVDGPTDDEQSPEPAAEPLVEPQISTIELQEEAEAAAGQTRIVGVVTLEGKPRKNKKINMARDKACMAQHVGVVRFEDVQANDVAQIRDAFVYVKSGLPKGKQFALPAAAVIDQRGCLYRPHVTGLMVNQPVKISNNDPLVHNVKMQSKKNGKWNRGMPANARPIVEKFKKPELGGILFKCDVHSWMGAFVHVVDHPFFAVSDVEGRFEIKGLPPGRYTLEAWHDHKKIKPVEFEVEVKAGTSHRQDVAVVYK